MNTHRAWAGAALACGLAATVCWAPLARAQGRIDELPMERKLELAAPFHTVQSEAVAPFTILGNIHYVGARNIASYLITTPEGHFLLDSGVREMEASVIANIEALGFRPDQVKLLLSSHAHFDHVQGHEALRRATGARVLVMRGDDEALRTGRDLSPLGFEGWTPVQVDGVLEHEQRVALGGTTLTAHRIPGHTPGCTVWTTRVSDRDDSLEVAILGCNGPNRGVQLVGNPRFPRLVEETRSGFSRLRALRPDVYLNGHPEALFAERIEAMRRGERPHPLLGQKPWAELVRELEQAFEARVVAESQLPLRTPTADGESIGR